MSDPTVDQYRSWWGGSIDGLWRQHEYWSSWGWSGRDECVDSMNHRRVLLPSVVDAFACIQRLPAIFITRAGLGMRGIILWCQQYRVGFSPDFFRCNYIIRLQNSSTLIQDSVDPILCSVFDCVTKRHHDSVVMENDEYSLVEIFGTKF